MKVLECFNEWYLDIDVNPTKEKIIDRTNGIKTYCKDISVENILNLIRMVFDLECPEDFVEDFVNAFKKIDPTFSNTYTKEIKLLAGTALAYLSETEYDKGWLIELLVTVNLNYHSTKINHEVLCKIVEQYEKDRSSIRKNDMDNNNSDIIIRLEEIKETCEEDDKWNENLVDILIDAFNINSKLEQLITVYKEDSQILWWMTSKWCNTLNCPINGLESDRICLLIGTEVADMIENFPGPSSIQVVLSNVMKNSRLNEKEISIDKIVNEAEIDWKKGIVKKAKKISFLDLLPLYSAVMHENNTTSIDEWYPKYKKDILNGEENDSFKCETYAYLMFLESLVIKLYETMKN